MTHTNLATEKLAELKREIVDANQSNIKILRSEQGGEFTGHVLRNFRATNVIRQEFTARHSLHQNGVAERPWRSLMNTRMCT